MINSRILSLVSSRLYFLFNGKIFHLEQAELVESNRENLDKALFPIIVIGREHYRESSKKYPVTNEKDQMKHRLFLPLFLMMIMLWYKCTNWMMIA
jgi:hypothetical protein